MKCKVLVPLPKPFQVAKALVPDPVEFKFNIGFPPVTKTGLLNSTSIIICFPVP